MLQFVDKTVSTSLRYFVVVRNHFINLCVYNAILYILYKAYIIHTVKDCFKRDRRVKIWNRRTKIIYII